MKPGVASLEMTKSVWLVPKTIVSPTISGAADREPTGNRNGCPRGERGRSATKSTRPLSPNSAAGTPVPASTAIR